MDRAGLAESSRTKRRGKPQYPPKIFFSKSTSLITQKELAENTSIDILKYFDDFFLFTRINLAFGWSPDVGKIAVWDVGPS